MHNSNTDQELKAMLVAPVQEAPSLEKVLDKARRDTGVRDLFSLMFVHLWVLLMRVMAPFFCMNHKPRR